MSELITTYMQDNIDVAIPMERNVFYQEQIDDFKNKKTSKRIVEIIHVLIFDSKGEIFIQKRSDDKTHNPGLLDKSIGGHMRFGDSNDYTVMVETVQELQVPSITLRTSADFMKTFTLLKGYLDTVAIIKHIDSKVYTLSRKIKNKDIPILHKVHLYFGIYNGSTRTVDREAKGVLLYELKDLKKDMKTSPHIFTKDIALLVDKYQSQINDFIKLMKTK